MTYKNIPGGVCAAKGFKAYGIHAGFRKNTAKLDLAMILADRVCNAAGVYTKNKVFAAPVGVTREHLKGGKARVVICNSGNANACTPDGYDTANACCKAVADMVGCAETEVIVSSTGVIGQSLPTEPLFNTLPALYASLEASENGADLAANAIMTTDTQKKELDISYEYAGKTISLGGMCKGSGMIHPNMGTMLGYITTDCSISSGMLQKALSAAIVDTFNMVSVDGDTSTNDTVCVMASGYAENEEITADGEAYDAFYGALLHLCTLMASAIAADGEGATKFLKCHVYGFSDKEGARVLAKSVIGSSLVKTAIFGSDANWGRVICALGYSGVDFDTAKVDIAFSSPAGTIDVCKDGAQLQFDEDIAKKILLEKDIVIECGMNCGSEEATALGCDLSYEYVHINGDYRS
ncbi:MAG: bifunctional glutamate N-acetyltransferase/amino-acid acetyltransferase ArgJ [Clostridia bacterium]|nr:bifunctional glutamate N-acetyltransferase/amino-acid acetyltransferase ArgJ [Clostridia bacterium]